ncbi:type II secretion system protein GspG [Tichowtungia aerotolerans]|uniref:Type II secretion system protein GspG C-terminal domain-containing protein n=1 Tax=Tichowtungia aerotolerans TaxID=2697043 RepID=A0A6P1M9B1_9BACT|nr:type II secretion system protein GspG [Tichowtungia aerotolerans]QHI68668.1 hypothetical protein GT409_04135 [Tichowtungia aerotolerans]
MSIKLKIGIGLLGAAIIVLLIVLCTPIQGTSKQYARRVLFPRATKADIVAINTSLDQYRIDTGAYPDQLLNLSQNSGAKNWNGPYIRENKLSDPWGQPFHYEIINNIPIVVSRGPDGELWSPDDIETALRQKLSEPIK